MSSHKRNKLIFLITVFIFIMLPSIASFNSAAAADKKKEAARDGGFKIGYADLAALLAFHPMMQYYSYDTNIFIRPLKGGISREEFLKQIRERQEKYKILRENTESELKKLQAEIDAIEGEINKLRVKVSREQAIANQKYSEDYTRLSDENTRKKRTAEYHSHLSKLDGEYYEEKKKLDEMKDKKQAAMNEIIMKISEVDYLNEVDSRNFFNSILDEIDDAVREVAEEKKIPAVLNSNYISMFTPNEMIVQNIYQTPVSAIQTNIPPMANYSYLIDAADGPAEQLATNEIAAKKEALKTECLKLMNRRVEIARLFARYQVLNRMVVYGGVDLTADALEKLLKKHAVADYKIPVIVETLRSLLNSRQNINEPVMGDPKH